MEDDGLISVDCTPQKTLDGYICTASLENFATIAKKFPLGTSFSTDSFAMHFDDSIGSSTWVMQIYPNGQFDRDGYGNGHLSAYLKLISAENENKSLFVDIEFNIVVINGFSQYKRAIQGKLRADNRCFDLSRKSAKWFGGQIAKLYDLPRSDHTLQIVCRLKLPKSFETGKFFLFKRIFPNLFV